MDTKFSILTTVVSSNSGLNSGMVRLYIGVTNQPMLSLTLVTNLGNLPTNVN